MHRNAHVNRDTHTHACRIHIREITQSHTCSHTLPPLLPWPHTPSHPRSLTHVRDVSWSKMPAGSSPIALPPSWSDLAREEAVSPHTLHQHTPAVSISMHMHVPHAHAPCTCRCAPWLSLSLHMRAPCMRARMCMCL